MLIIVQQFVNDDEGEAGNIDLARTAFLPEVTEIGMAAQVFYAHADLVLDILAIL